MTEECRAPDFRTNDIALAAYLFDEGNRYVCDMVDGFVTFIFAWSDDLDGIVNDYRDGVAQVEPRDFTRAIAHVKKAMYRTKGDRRPAAHG